MIDRGAITGWKVVAAFLLFAGVVCVLHLMGIAP
jgi:hypothetical protein